MANTDDASLVDDYHEPAVVKDGWQKNFNDQYPLTYPCLHQPENKSGGGLMYNARKGELEGQEYACSRFWLRKNC